jgi:hypothetical protein
MGRSIVALFLLLCLADAVHAQTSAPLRVFVECNECYMTEMKQKLTFVQYVRDRAESDVHIQTHWEATNRGGRRIHLQMLGQNQYASIKDTFLIDVESWHSSSAVYAKIEEYIRAGLVRFMAYSNNLSQISIAQIEAATIDTASTPPIPIEDPWDHWNMSLYLSGWLNGESNYDNLNLNSTVSAYRVTRSSKINFSFNNSYNENNYEFSDGSTFKSLSRSNGINASTVRSISERWSLGVFGKAENSTYYNLKRHLQLGPGIEYAFFPYEESSTHHLMLQYRINGHIVQYNEQTLYDKTEEKLFDQSLKLAFLIRRDWGTVEFDVTGKTYLHDFSKTNANFYSQLEINLIPGLSLDLYGNLQYANDQLYLPKLGATEEETLLRLEQLKTNYTYWANVGFSYTFGSSDASVVNSRFGS